MECILDAHNIETNSEQFSRCVGENIVVSCFRTLLFDFLCLLYSTKYLYNAPSKLKHL